MNAVEIFKKLKFDKSKKSLIINAPDEYERLLIDTDFDREYNLSNAGTYDFVQIFAASQAELENIVAQVSSAGKYDCLFWICYPKGKSDIKRETVWKGFEIAHLRPVSQIAIDETWSALRGRPSEKVGK
jgi:hypothetical protein